MKLHIFITLLIFLMPQAASAGDGEQNRPSFLKRAFDAVKTFVDSSSIKDADRSYLELPKKPWAIELRSSSSESMLKMHSDFPTISGKYGRIDTETRNGFSTSLGLWVGYRGYGIGLNKELTSGNGTLLSLGATGNSYGINLRINSYRSDEPKIRITYDGKQMEFDENEAHEIDNTPIKVRSLFLDGYYMFNSKRFSYPAAYDQSLIQRRSAGSFMAGAMYFHSSINYSDNSNWPLVAFTKGVGKMKFTQAAVGAGYTYNCVPARGWLVNIMVMPMLQFYNSMNAYTYSIYDEEGEDITESLVADFEDDASDDDIYEDITDEQAEKFTLAENGVQHTHNKVGFNFDARIAVVYNWDRWYLRAHGQFNRFHYSNDMSNGRMQEWCVNAALGFRF